MMTYNDIVIKKVANGWIVTLPDNDRSNSPMPNAKDMKEVMRSVMGVMNEDPVLGRLQEEIDAEENSLYIERDKKTFAFYEGEELLSFLSGVIQKNDSGH